MATPINQLSGMPSVDTALSGWKQQITLETVVETIDVNGFKLQTKTSVTFKGTIQPLTPEKIQLKPEGQRSWQWLQIHAIAGSLNLQTSDRIIYRGIEYKVMGIFDYTLNSFIEYHVIKDYQN